MPTMTKQILNELYWEKELSLREIAKIFRKDPTTIRRRMKKYGIPRRKSIDVCTKYQKTPFSGDLTEKAYLIGLRYGDIGARRRSRQVEVRTTTTHPAMMKLFTKVFGRYGRVKSIPKLLRRQRRYEWYIACLLDQSFIFLLERPQSAPQWILQNNDHFKSFLAGFFDSDGCICISRSNEKYIHFGFELYNTNHNVLKDIGDKLAEIGYHPHFYYKPKKDCWTLGLGIREEAFRFLQLLPLHHNEKQRKLKLALEIRNAKYWSEVSKRVMTLRKQIEEEVRLCVLGALEDYQRRHKEEILPQPPKYHTLREYGGYLSG